VADRRGITSAMTTVFGDTSERDLDKLAPVSSGEVVRVVEDEELRLNVVRVLAVLALLDGLVEYGKIELVLDFATALHVHAEFVDALHQLQMNHARWVGYDMIRANVFTIPGVPLLPEDPYKPFLPYGGDGTDSVLSERYERLGSLSEASFGRTFYDHYKENGYAFPGNPEGMVEAWATAHDCLHILSGYSTSAQGELLVAAFTGGALDPTIDFMESHIVPTILIYHLGIDINKGLNAGDRDRMDADPTWADNYDGNVHLGLDAKKLWIAWERGRAMTENVYSGHWDFWAHVARRSPSCVTAGASPTWTPSLRRSTMTTCVGMSSSARACQRRPPFRPSRLRTARPRPARRSNRLGLCSYLLRYGDRSPAAIPTMGRFSA
jgi:hypothetical protein